MTPENLILVRPYRSPCGEMTLGAFGGKLCLCDWARPKHPGRTARARSIREERRRA